MTSPETDWRIAKDGWSEERTTWKISEYTNGEYTREIARDLDEPTARLIAAAPEMQAFLKSEVVENRHDPFFTTRANEILKKAGATK